MIRKYTFGTPFPTEAGVVPVECQQGQLPYFTISADGKERFGVFIDHPGQVDFEQVKTIAFVKTKASYEYYHDDGISTGVTLDGHIRTLISEG